MHTNVVVRKTQINRLDKFLKIWKWVAVGLKCLLDITPWQAKFKNEETKTLYLLVSASFSVLFQFWSAWFGGFDSFVCQNVPNCWFYF